jgi:hypothetical protein
MPNGFSFYHVIRNCTPKPVIQGIKKVIEACDPAFVFLYRTRQGFKTPIPPMHLRARIGRRWLGEFIRAGFNCKQGLENALVKFTGKQISDYQRVMDFDCSCGRTLQHLFWTKPDHSRYYGCDVVRTNSTWTPKRTGGTASVAATWKNWKAM